MPTSKDKKTAANELLEAKGKADESLSKALKEGKIPAGAESQTARTTHPILLVNWEDRKALAFVRDFAKKHGLGVRGLGLFEHTHTTEVNADKSVVLLNDPENMTGSAYTCKFCDLATERSDPIVRHPTIKDPEAFRTAIKKDARTAVLGLPRAGKSLFAGGIGLSDIPGETPHTLDMDHMLVMDEMRLDLPIDVGPILHVVSKNFREKPGWKGTISDAIVEVDDQAKAEETLLKGFSRYSGTYKFKSHVKDLFDTGILEPIPSFTSRNWPKDLLMERLRSDVSSVINSVLLASTDGVDPRNLRFDPADVLHQALFRLTTYMPSKIFENGEELDRLFTDESFTSDWRKRLSIDPKTVQDLRVNRPLLEEIVKEQITIARLRFDQLEGIAKDMLSVPDNDDLVIKYDSKNLLPYSHLVIYRNKGDLQMRWPPSEIKTFESVFRNSMGHPYPWDANPIDLEVRVVPLDLALSIFRNLHYIHTPRADAAIGLYVKGGRGDALPPLSVLGMSSVDREYKKAALIAQGYDPSRVWELTRLYNAPNAPKNTSSIMIAEALRYLRGKQPRPQAVTTAFMPSFDTARSLLGGNFKQTLLVKPLKLTFGRQGDGWEVLTKRRQEEYKGETISSVWPLLPTFELIRRLGSPRFVPITERNQAIELAAWPDYMEAARRPLPGKGSKVPDSKMVTSYDALMALNGVNAVLRQRDERKAGYRATLPEMLEGAKVREALDLLGYTDYTEEDKRSCTLISKQGIIFIFPKGQFRSTMLQKAILGQIGLTIPEFLWLYEGNKDLSKFDQFFGPKEKRGAEIISESMPTGLKSEDISRMANIEKAKYDIDEIGKTLGNDFKNTAKEALDELKKRKPELEAELSKTSEVILGAISQIHGMLLVGASEGAIPHSEVEGILEEYKSQVGKMRVEYSLEVKRLAALESVGHQEFNMAMRAPSKSLIDFLLGLDKKYPREQVKLPDEVFIGDVVAVLSKAQFKLVSIGGAGIAFCSQDSKKSVVVPRATMFGPEKLAAMLRDAGMEHQEFITKLEGLSIKEAEDGMNLTKRVGRAETPALALPLRRAVEEDLETEEQNYRSMMRQRELDTWRLKIKQDFDKEIAEFLPGTERWTAEMKSRVSEASRLLIDMVENVTLLLAISERHITVPRLKELEEEFERGLYAHKKTLRIAWGALDRLSGEELSKAISMASEPIREFLTREHEKIVFERKKEEIEAEESAATGINNVINADGTTRYD